MNLKKNRILVGIIFIIILLQLVKGSSYLTKEEILSCDKQKNYCDSTIINIYNKKKERMLGPISRIKGIEIYSFQGKGGTHYKLLFEGINCGRIFVYEFHSKKQAENIKSEIESLLKTNANFNYRIKRYTNKFDYYEKCNM